MEDPNCYDRRSEKDKQKYGHKLVVRRDFPVLTPLASSSTTTDGCLVGILLPVIILMCYLHHACMQCAKQPEGSVLCGYYACEYLRACGKFNNSWRQLQKSQSWWEKETIDRRNITQTVADICKFVTDQCCHVDGRFFYIGSELATEERFEKLRNWRTSGLDMNDYRLPDIFE